MKRNAILTGAVMVALGCAGAVAAQDTASQCADKAAQLKTQIEGSQKLADPDRARLEDSLSEAATADVARCDQIVARVERELGANGSDEIPGASDEDDYSSSAAKQPKSESSTADTTVNSGYEEGHAAAAESMPDHPGAAANQTDPASTTMADKGYGSADSTIAANEDQSPSAGAETADELGTNTQSESAGTTSSRSGTVGSTGSPTSTDTGSTTSGASTAATGTGGGSLAGMTADDLVNKRVKTADGEDVGEIDSIVTDKMSQAHGYAVVGVGGVLGVGEKKVLVDLDQLQLTADGDVRTSANSERDFDSYPTYDEKNFDKYDGDIGRLL